MTKEKWAKIKDGNWHHYAQVYHGDGTLTHYVDGVSVLLEKEVKEKLFKKNNVE
jgi:hypothetical protein